MFTYIVACMKARYIIALFILLILAIGVVYVTTRKTQPLIVYSADAYTKEVSELLSLFHNQTGVPVAPVHGGGSLALAREISQGVPVSVFVSVALIAYSQSYLGSRYSGWAIAFVADQMVLAYSNSTNPVVSTVVKDFKTAESTNSSKYYYYAFNNLTSGKLKIGISNPNDDPAGFRGWLVLEMAGFLYANDTQYFVKRTLENRANVTASNAAQLVSPLLYGDIQFLFIYRSAAIAKHLNYIELPRHINLGDPSLSSFYSQFTYNLSTGVVHGSPVYLFLSVPSNAVDSAQAYNFVKFVIEHSSILQSYGLTPLKPAILFNDTHIPQQLASLLSTGEVIRGGAI